MAAHWLLVAAAMASEPAAAVAPAFETKGAFFAASVADLDASSKWYADKLGLKVIFRSPKTQGSAVTVLQGGGLTVELLADDAAVPLATAAPQITRDYRVHGIFKAGIFVEDWPGLLAKLKQRSIPIALGPFEARDGQPANLLIRDNDGNFLQFFEAPGPRSRAR